MPDREQDAFFSGPQEVTVGVGNVARRVRIARMTDREGARETLARGLIPDWPHRGVVDHDVLGRPLAATPEFHLSFSRLRRPQSATLIYGAACTNGADKILGLGIDAAHASEFDATYPWARAFTASELALLGARVSVAREHALLALVWACKEAAVKALGVGFHHCDPRDVVGVDCHTLSRMFAVRMRAACRNRVFDVDCMAWIEAESWIVVGLACSHGPKNNSHPRSNL